MNTDSIIAELDGEIRRLTEARNLLTGSTDVPNGVSGGAVRGRPGLVSIAASASSEIPTATIRKSSMSPEGRKRIADAMRKRWAEKRSVPVAAKKATKIAKAK